MIKTLLSLILLHKSAHINPFAIPYDSIYDHFASIQPQHRIGGIRLQGITGTQIRSVLVTVWKSN